ncbi:SET and MYND domain containing, class 5 [Rhodnius prolixus]|uniref:SET domain-containing protein n=2 Tax=Rhodnius TaxID=13248 RepID=R4G8F7_RHOPR
METDFEEINSSSHENSTDILIKEPSIEIRTAGAHKGVGIFAFKDFCEGDVIFEEEPIVAAQFYWNEKYGYLACHHCLRPMESTVENIKRLSNNENIVLSHPNLCPTDKSKHVYCDCGVGFCSTSCKELSWEQYHKCLCTLRNPSLNKLLKSWSGFHYPPETSSIMLLLKMIAIIELSSNYDEAVSTFLKFQHNYVNEDENMLMKFLGSEYAENFRIVHSLLHEVFPCKFVKEFVTEDGLRKLFALIGRNGQGIGTSVYSEWVKKVEKLDLNEEEKSKMDIFINKVYDAMNEHVGTFLNCEGSGLYKMQKNINHSCNPNATVTFPHSNFTLSLIASKNIKAGEEICVSYLDECNLFRSRHSRRVILRNHYLFECHCEKCTEQAGDPDVTSEEESSNEDESISEDEAMES